MFATRTPRQSREVSLASLIRVFPATKSSGALTRWDRAFAVGKSARGSASAFSRALAGYCEFCRGGDLVNCQNQENTGIHHDGGYAEVLLAKASGLMSIPDDLSSVRRSRPEMKLVQGLLEVPRYRFCCDAQAVAHPTM